MDEVPTVAVIGGGPAGLRAAEVAAEAGLRVMLYEGKPSVGRKLLVAGKGGLNLTHGEALDAFVTRYSGPDTPPEFWTRLIEAFGPSDLRQWAEALGVETFQAGSGRVYPKALKAAPLLRRWLARLDALGVRIFARHRLSELSPGDRWRLEFDNGVTNHADAVILATGGGSWPRTGSDGTWMAILERLGLPLHPLVAANCGWERPWPDAVAAMEGEPLKNVHVHANGTSAAGELMITRYGLEGGTIYQLGAVLREMDKPEITIDFKPTFTRQQLIAKMESVRKNHLDEAVIRWRLSKPMRAMLSNGDWMDAKTLADAVKSFPVPLVRPRPLAEAISSAGGVAWAGIDEKLMSRGFPGLFFAGEMIDWEAPTGGYLLQACFSTGTLAAKSASAHALHKYTRRDSNP